MDPQLKSSEKDSRPGETRGRLMVACSECRRRRVKCDGMSPCSNCVRRGWASVCRDETPTTSQASSDREDLYLQKITQMSHRIGQLEEALAKQQSTLSDETHPLLTDERLKIKSLGEFLEGVKMPTPQGSKIHPEGDEVNVGVIRKANATGFQGSEVITKKRPRALASISALPPYDAICHSEQQMTMLNQSKPPSAKDLTSSPSQHHNQEENAHNFSVGESNFIDNTSLASNINVSNQSMKYPQKETIPEAAADSSAHDPPPRLHSTFGVVENRETTRNSFLTQFFDTTGLSFDQQVIDLAQLNSHFRSTRPRCYSGTRENILRVMRPWSRECGGLMFLRGAAGVGKTTILQTFAKQESQDQRRLATVFYEPRFSEQVSNFGRLVFPILARQLAQQNISYATAVRKVLRDHRSLLDESLQKQFDMLIAGPCTRFGSGVTYLKPLLIILDGLDGRGMDKELYLEMVQLISRNACTADSTRISWIISNPPESLALPSSLTAREIDIPIDSDDACEDLERFLRDEFNAIGKRFPARTPEQWPSEDDLIRVATAASGYFAFATSVIDFVGDPSIADPVGRLGVAIAYITGRNRDISPFATLDILYSGTLHRASLSELSTAMLLISLFLLPSVRFSKTPPSIVVACNILRLSESVVHSSLSQLSALLEIPPANAASARPLKFLHSSFEDFLLDPARSGTHSIKLATHAVVIRQCCTAIAQQVNSTPDKSGGLEHIQLTWCPTGSNEEEERKNVYVFAARILASLWGPRLL